MNILLPTFTKTDCTSLIACAKVEGSTVPIKKIMSKNDQYIASYNIPKEKAYLRLVVGGKEKNHLHVECALSQYFPKDKPPILTHKKETVLKILDYFKDVKIKLGIIGTFECLYKDVPDNNFIKKFATEEKTNDISFRLISGEFEVKGAPVSNIKWKIDEKYDKVKIRVRSITNDAINDEYLIRSFDWIDKQYKIFILGKL